MLRIDPLDPSAPADAVARLHQALQVLGFPVDAAEVREQRAGDSTRLAVRAFQQRNGLPLTERRLVDEATAALINARLTGMGLVTMPDGGPDVFLVKGRVTTADGEPYCNALVSAFDRGLRRRQALGNPTSSGRSGDFVIPYLRTDLLRPERGGA